MGFLLAAKGLLLLYININVFKLYYGDDCEGLFEFITGYGRRGSSMALLGRVGEGIYTKAADVVLGYKSAIISILAIAASICVSFSFEAMYGITVGVLLMLSTIATESAIEIYDSISGNFGGIIDMVGMSHCIREGTNALYAVGNSNATIGK
ncbi:hypothetical protein Peur_029400 [Populus x canadensis]